MKTTAWMATMASALLFACSSGSGTGFSGGSGAGGSGTSDDGGGSSTGSGSGVSSGSASSGSGSSGSSGSGSGSGASTGSSGSSGASSGGSQGGPDASIPTDGPSATLTADTFTVAPGAEVYKCQVFANPFGKSVDILSMHGTMNAGSHHFFLFNMDPSVLFAYSGVTGHLGDCPGKGLEFHPFPFLSQQPDWTVTFPTASDGSPMGYPLVAANSLMINVHYLNATSMPINASVSITIQAAKPGVVTTHVGTLFLNQTGLSVPPTPMSGPPSVSMGSWGGNPGAASSDGSYKIFTSWSHMHRYATQLAATTNGQTIYQESNWDEPKLFWHMPGYANPSTATGPTSPIPMTSSQGINWTCNYYNPTGSTMTFGDSALTNVMCIYMAQYYPASPTNPDVIFVFN